MCVKINSATGYFKEKNDDKYLILDSTKEYESVWSEIKSEIKRINGGEEVFYEKSYCKVGINTEDDFPLNESLKFLTLTVNINLVFQVDNKLYPQIYLDECFFELQILYKKNLKMKMRIRMRIRMRMTMTMTIRIKTNKKRFF